MYILNSSNASQKDYDLEVRGANPLDKQLWIVHGGVETLDASITKRFCLQNMYSKIRVHAQSRVLSKLELATTKKPITNLWNGIDVNRRRKSNIPCKERQWTMQAAFWQSNTSEEGRFSWVIIGLKCSENGYFNLGGHFEASPLIAIFPTPASMASLSSFSFLSFSDVLSSVCCLLAVAEGSSSRGPALIHGWLRHWAAVGLFSGTKSSIGMRKSAMSVASCSLKSYFSINTLLRGQKRNRRICLKSPYLLKKSLE